MKINIKATRIDITPSLKIYIESKLGSLGKFVRKFDAEGVAEMWLEVGRTTRHHHKGPVFRAEADLRLPKKILRAEEESYDLRASIDVLKNKIHVEIEKYKARFEKGRRELRRSRRA
ncbi:ribosome-associated translation inhibitor RaiA [Candidatus Parcubacteria bacterium]|nr:MAG: ribosome-associated translation inhibitor RaiA [Candidatus Parcubacteria bacterium]